MVSLVIVSELQYKHNNGTHYNKVNIPFITSQ